MTTATVERERADIDAVVEGQTLVDLFERNAAEHGDKPAIHWKDGDLWKFLTWSQYRRAAHRVAAGLAALGVEPGDFVAIQSGNRPEHVIADMGAVHAGAAGVTIYSTLQSEQVQFIADNCSAKVAVLENLEFMKRWEEIKGSLPALTHVVLMEGAENYETLDWVLSWDELLDRGEQALSEDSGLIERITSEITPESLATLIYTSGTTGTPKGVMITHRNVLWTAESVNRVAQTPPNPRMVSYLPLAHIAERMTSHYNGMYLAGEVFYCPDMADVLEYIQKARPTLFVGVPRVYEKFHARLMSNFDQHEKRDLVVKALDNATELVTAEQNGNRPGFRARAQHAVFDKLVFSKVRAQLGMDQVHVAITAAAPIDPDLIVFFNALGIRMGELYGMSEDTGPATANPLDANKIGTVGKALPGVEVTLADDGEVLIRGGIVAAGYYRMPEQTAETFDADGWLHSGDLGEVDEDGYLRIVGRKKDIIITAAGKNIAPATLETAMKQHPLVAQVCMVGDRRNYLTMLIALDAEEAPGWAEANGLEYTDLSSFSGMPEVHEEIQRTLDEANRHVARVEQVKKFHIVPDDWTPGSGEVTPTLKLKRNVVLDRYADDIERMYAE